MLGVFERYELDAGKCSVKCPYPILKESFGKSDIFPTPQRPSITMNFNEFYI